MPRSTDARQRMIESAATLFRERGVQGTSFADVLAHSGAPRGSVYHHFAGGKAQLAEETVRWSGELIVAGAAAALEHHDPVAAIGLFRDQWTALLRECDYAAGCPILAAALEGEHTPSVRDAAGDVFAAWEDVLAAALRTHGLPPERARSLAALMLAAVEGSIVLSRARRSTLPLEHVTTELEAIIALALDRPTP